jgi:hypothetical protein
MDLMAMIRELHAERERVTRAIEALEEMAARVNAFEKKSRRGRKGMNEAERRAVSERMKKYWARRRAAARKSRKEPSEPQSPPPG